jgi:hypothetical protein
MARHLRLTQIGAGCAGISVIAAAAAVVMFPSFAGAEPGLAWADGALVSAVLMLAICVIQVVVWRRAMASWLGKRPQDLHGEKRLSWIAHLMSYVVALAALFRHHGGQRGSWLVIGLGRFVGRHPDIPTLPRRSLAGVQFLRASGPPGTIPAHIRRLKELSRDRND